MVILPPLAKFNQQCTNGVATCYRGGRNLMATLHQKLPDFPFTFVLIFYSLSGTCVFGGSSLTLFHCLYSGSKIPGASPCMDHGLPTESSLIIRIDNSRDRKYDYNKHNSNPSCHKFYYG